MGRNRYHSFHVLIFSSNPILFFFFTKKVSHNQQIIKLSNQINQSINFSCALFTELIYISIINYSINMRREIYLHMAMESIKICVVTRVLGIG